MSGSKFLGAGAQTLSGFQNLAAPTTASVKKPFLTPQNATLAIPNALTVQQSSGGGGGGGGGTVTSVGLTMPTGFSVTGTPVTGAGTLAVSYLGQFPATSMPAFTGDMTTSAGSTVTTVLQSSTTFALNGIISVTSVTNPTNNWSPTGLSTANVIRVGTAGTSATITGLTGGALGRVILLQNVDGSNQYQLIHESASSTAANRFHLPNLQNYTIGPGCSVMLWYDTTQSRWLISAGTFGMLAVAGDISGSLPSGILVTGINGTPLGSTIPTDTNLLIANGTEFVSVTPTGDVTFADTGATTVAKINGATLGTTTPTAGHLLIGNAFGTAWVSTGVSGDGTLTAGGVLTISKINGGGIWNLLSAASDQTVTNSATLTSDTALTFSMAASTNYRIRGHIWLDGTSITAAAKYAFSGPASPTLVRFSRYDNANGAAPTGRAIDVAIPGSTTLVTGTSATGEMLHFEGIVQNGSNAGTFVFQFAQATATAAQSVIRRAGSYMEWAVA